MGATSEPLYVVIGVPQGLVLKSQFFISVYNMTKMAVTKSLNFKILFAEFRNVECVRP